MRLKILKDGQLVNVIESTMEWAEANFPGCQIVPEPFPAGEPPMPPRRLVSKLDFRRRFTFEELVRFDNPELFIPSLTDMQRATIRTMQRNFDLAQFIDLDDPWLIEGLSSMVSYGLLSQHRVSEILGG